MKKGFRIRSFKNLLLMFLSAAIFTYFAQAFSINFLKPIAAILQFWVLYVSIQTVVRSKYVDKFKLILFSLPLFIYPFLSAIIAGISVGTIKGITDVVFLKANFFSLPIVALALICISIREKSNYQDALANALLLSAGLFFALSSLGFLELSSAFVGTAYSLANNLLVPLFIFALIKNGPRFSPILLMAAFGLLAISSIIGSRSYLVVATSLLILTSFQGHYARVAGRVCLILILATLLAPLTSSSFLDLAYSTTVFQKLNWASLRDTLQMTYVSGDLMSLWYWEGNSRSGIIEDAFTTLDGDEYTFGAGFFATYQSFVERNTIEIGWAQVQFWVGFFYTIPLGFIVAFSMIQIRRSRIRFKSRFLAAISTLATARVIDGFIYGMPTYDMYNLLFWTAVMFSCLTPLARKEFLDLQAFRLKQDNLTPSVSALDLNSRIRAAR